MRADRKPASPSQAQTAPFPAPTAGWVENENLAVKTMHGARILENFFPTQTGIRVRGGRAAAATIGSNDVVSLFSYNSATAQALFATDTTSIFDISALDPNTAPTADVTGQTEGYYSTAQMGAVGGEYLYAVNGADNAQLFDGSTWTQITGVSSPAITGQDTATFSHVWKHRNRLWFVEGGSMDAHYLPVDQIAGATAQFSLAGVFQQGGRLLFGATWSLDAGDGQDDRQVFVSSEGEVAVYQGSDPSDPTDWALVGLFSVSRPLGQNASMRAGGDLLIATQDGIVPMSSVVQKDTAALSLAAVTKKIERTWVHEAGITLPSQQWELQKWPRENMMIVSQPHDNTKCLVANLQTGAWAKYTNWDVRCMALHNDFVYFGSANGEISLAESTGTDGGVQYVAKASFLPDQLGSPGQFKMVCSMRATFLANTAFSPKLSVAVDYRADFPTPPILTVVNTAPDTWGVGEWGTAFWSGDGFEFPQTVTTRWKSISKNGHVVAPQVQIVVGDAIRPDVELSSLELVYTGGGVVV